MYPGLCIEEEGKGGGGGMLRRCVPGHYGLSTNQPAGYTYWTLDSGHLSLSTTPSPHHLLLLLILLFRGRPGGVSEEDGQGRIELEPPPFLHPGSTCRCPYRCTRVRVRITGLRYARLYIHRV